MSTQPIESSAPLGDPSRPRLSLCLATYNRARYLDRYLTHHLSALDLAGVDYELVVSDNCSTDATPEILARYAARHPRMRVTRQRENVGAYPNILTTLHQARGEVIVSIADDDLAVPHQLLAYVQRMIDDPALVMIQAPWFLVDERKTNAVIGKFYHLQGESRFERGAFAACLAFVIEHHVFPECCLIRRSALASIAGPTPRFTYGYFAMLANALRKGDVLFCPEPHVAATAVARGAGEKVGNSEAMDSWDVYRGGLELLASCARQYDPAGAADAAAVGAAITGFVCERMAVAARLQAHAGNWSNAYQILRRLHAYGLTPAIDFPPDDVAVFAAVETMLLECAQRGASEVVVEDTVPDHVLERMNPVAGVRVIRAEAVGAGDVRRAFCSVGAAADPAMRGQDFSFDIVAAIERFPLLPEA
ncbi:MAG TPA: glycosyltransferase [Caulobacteraceae bacterium]|jgi:hypothetical protein|nr:glycosyltransferase [Caulobacteraceae bacterium]